MLSQHIIFAFFYNKIIFLAHSHSWKRMLFGCVLLWRCCWHHLTTTRLWSPIGLKWGGMPLSIATHHNNEETSVAPFFGLSALNTKRGFLSSPTLYNFEDYPMPNFILFWRTIQHVVLHPCKWAMLILWGLCLFC